MRRPVRHGQSTWNDLNLFTGWADCPLSDLGVEEATAGGVEIKTYTPVSNRGMMTPARGEISRRMITDIGGRLMAIRQVSHRMSIGGGSRRSMAAGAERAGMQQWESRAGAEVAASRRARGEQPPPMGPLMV